MEAPVVLNPEAISKKLSTKDILFDKTKGKEPKSVTRIHTKATIKKPSLIRMALFEGVTASVSRTPIIIATITIT